MNPDEALCEDCLDRLDYGFCDECEEYWPEDLVEFVTLSDGRRVCEYCAEDLDTDEMEDEDEE